MYVSNKGEIADMTLNESHPSTRLLAAVVLVAGACFVQLGGLPADVRVVDDDLTDTRDCLFRTLDCANSLAYYADSFDTPVFPPGKPAVPSAAADSMGM